MSRPTARTADAPSPSGDGSHTPVGRLRRALRLAVVLVGVAVVVASPWWGRAGLERLDFFRVQRVEILGLRHLPPEEVLARLQVDTFASVWQRLDPLAARVRAHPDLEDARVSRRLPGTLVVTVRERVPVALVPAPDGMRVFDGRGVALPLDPTRAGVDAPVVASADTLVLRLLENVRVEEPALFARISEVRRAGSELLVMLASLPVRARSDLTVARLAEVIPVEEDLKRRGILAAELDLRFRDQVIARLQ